MVSAAHRINIETRFWNDPRYLELRGLLGEDKAIAACVRAWALAQAFWTAQGGSKLISEALWKQCKFPEALIRVGLAERRKDGVYVRGTDDATQWVLARQENSAKGGAATKTKYSKQNKEQVGPKGGPEVGPDGSPPSPSPSPSLKKETTTTLGCDGNLKELIKIAWGVWVKTLAVFKIPAMEMIQMEELSLAKGIGTLGFETVLLALEGQRYEKPSKDFNPSQHLSIDRCLHKINNRSNWQRFKNMALAERERLRVEKENQEQAEVTG